MYQLQVYVEGQFLGAGEIGLIQWKHGLFKPNSEAFCCQGCGRIWAYAIVIADDVTWMFSKHPCGNCGIGSLYRSWAPELMKAMPIEFHEREFLLAMSDRKNYTIGARIFTKKERTHFTYHDEPEEPNTPDDVAGEELNAF